MIIINGSIFHPSGPQASAEDLTEDEEAEAVDEDVVDDVTAEDEDDEAEVEDDENAELVSDYRSVKSTFWDLAHWWEQFFLKIIFKPYEEE